MSDWRRYNSIEDFYVGMQIDEENETDADENDGQKQFTVMTDLYTAFVFDSLRSGTKEI